MLTLSMLQPASFVPVLSSPLDTSYFDDFSNPDGLLGYKDVLLRQAQVQEAEAAAAAAASKGVPGGVVEARGGKKKEGNALSQGGGGDDDPWRGLYAGFSFRHSPRPDPSPK